MHNLGLSIIPNFIVSSAVTTSKVEPREITKKFFRSALLNLLQPSAIFNTMLNDALRSWSFNIRSNDYIDNTSSFIIRLNSFAFW